jgi:predicted PurR-regulated permease PerM
MPVDGVGGLLGYVVVVAVMQALDLRTTAPRRWSDELGGIRWLPRMIDKARAAMKGTLGDYLYGQSPMDQSLLRALGLSYKDFTRAVRDAGDDDRRVLELLEERAPDGLDLARRWSERLPQRRAFLFIIDLDDGYYGGPLQALRGVIRLSYSLIARWMRYRWPAHGSLIGREVEAQAEGVKHEATRGTDEEPYRWLTPQTLDNSWKILLSIVLIFLIFSYVVRFLERIGVIFLIIVGAIFFAYLVYPLVKWLNRKLPLILSILVVYMAIAALIVLGLFYLIPTATSEVTTLVHDWPSIQAKIVDWVQDPNNKLLSHAPPQLRNEIAQAPRAIVSWIQTNGTAAIGNAFIVLISTVAFIGACVAIPVLGAYLLYDSETIKRFFMGFIPARRRDATLTLLGELESVIGGFIRGQLLVGLTVGILMAIGLTLVGEPYAILIGAIAGALDLIPYIGPVIASIPAFTIAFIAGGFPLAVKVAIVFVLANQAEGHIIAPNIVSRTIQLSPSAVVIAILIGAELYGIIGMFIAVPVAGIIRVLLLHVIPGSVSRDEAKPVLTKDPHDSAEEAAAP